MSDTPKQLEGQSTWQKGRAALTWPEKVRMAEAVRESLAQLRRTRPPLAAGGSGSRYPGTSSGITGPRA